MDSYNATTPLLSQDYSVEDAGHCNDLYIHDDDSSSGYDSTDVSDIEDDSVHTSHARATEGILLTKRNQTPNTAKFKSTYALCEDLKLILDMPDMCDVTFLVGPNQIPVHGVRAILGTRSKVFYQLILKHLHMRNTQSERFDKRHARQTTYNRLTIAVRKYDPEVFRMLVQFIHCGTVSITVNTVSGLICGADQFELPELADACWEYIDMCLISGLGESLLFPTRLYRQHRAAKIILNKIYSVLDRRFVTGMSPPAKESTV